MNKKIICFFLLSIFIPFSFAYAAGLVPCSGTGTDGSGLPKCTWNHFLVLTAEIINFMLTSVAFPVSALFIVIGAFYIMTGGGNSSRIQKGKDAITSAIIGLVISLGAWVILSLVVQALCLSGSGRAGIDFRPWTTINKCSEVPNDF